MRNRSVLSYSARSPATPAEAWALLARPERWHEWAPHVRGAWGLGDPEVVQGARGAARLLGAVPVPARVTEVRSGRSWTWQVGPVSMVHLVRSPARGLRGGDRVARRRVRWRPALAFTYGPVVGLLVRRLARVTRAPAAAPDPGSAGPVILRTMTGAVQPPLA